MSDELTEAALEEALIAMNQFAVKPTYMMVRNPVALRILRWIREEKWRRRRYLQRRARRPAQGGGHWRPW